MDIIKYINNGFYYKSMIDRINEMEQKINMFESQIIMVDNRTRPTYEIKDKLEYGLSQLCDTLKSLGIDPYKADDIKFQLKEAIEWNY